MVASYKIQTAAQDLISVRLELLGEKPEAPEATEGEEPVVVEAPVLSTITQPLVFEGGALTLPFEVEEAPEEEAERPASRASRSSKASEPAEEEEEEEAEAPPKEITMRWAFQTSGTSSTGPGARGRQLPRARRTSAPFLTEWMRTARTRLVSRRPSGRWATMRVA